MAKIQKALIEVSTAIKRFPLPLILSLICVFSLWFSQNEWGRFENFWAVKLAGILGVAIPLFLSIKLYSERKTPAKSFALIAYFFISCLLAVYYYFYANHPVHNARMGLILLSSWFSIFLIPHIGNKDGLAYWEFNKTLLLRAVLSSLFSLALIAGLSLAIAAMDKLFSIHFNDGKIYFRIFTFVGIFINMIILLMGIPKDYPSGESEVNYPKVIRLFTQYVLLPLSVIYLIILYVYSGKILFEFNLPKGWASGLISAYATVGLVAFAALYPLKEKWARYYSKYFFYFLSPLFILLFISINKRISDYGITNDRYILIASAISLLIITIYYIIGKNKSLKLIPLLITLAPLIICFGPWGVFSVSESSQTSKMIKLIEDNKIIDNGIVKYEGLNDSLLKEIREIDSYLEFHFCADKLKEYFAAKNVNTKDSSYLKLFSSYEGDYYSNRNGFDYRLKTTQSDYNCENYDKIVIIPAFEIQKDFIHFEYNGDKFKITSFQNNRILISIEGIKSFQKEINLNEFNSLFEKNIEAGVSKEKEIPNSEWMSIYSENDKYKFKLYCKNLEQNSGTKIIKTFAPLTLLIGKR